MRHFEYAEAHDEGALLFAWTKTADESLDELRDFGERPLGVHGEA